MIKKVGITLLLFVLVFSLIQIDQAKANTGVDRIFGESRYDTAGMISLRGWNRAETIVIASGETFPDALAGGPLAYQLNAPILLTYKHRLPAETRKFINILEAKQAYILGGVGAIDLYVEKQLRDLGLKITRIGGDDRFQTAAKIADYLPSDQAIVANGRNFPDALAVAPYAAKNGIPIVLTESTDLPESTKEITDEKEDTIIVGGEGVISSTVASDLPSSTRFGGADRYETAKNIIEGLPLGKETAYVATGGNFADALSGSVLAAKDNAPILLVKKDDIPPSIGNLVNSYPSFSIFGGKNAVSYKVEEQLIGSTEEFQFQGVHVDATEEFLRSVLGAPDRIDESRFNFDWYVYNKDPETYIQFGVFHGIVVAMYSNSDSWKSESGLKLGVGQQEVRNVMDQIGAEHDQSDYVYDEKLIRLYYDQNDGDALSGMFIVRQDFTMTNPDFNKEKVRVSMEKQLLDQANALRARHFLDPLEEDSRAREVARDHSKDMAVRNFFSHENPDGLTPFQRMKQAGISYSSAGENIAAGQLNAIAVHDAWVNSDGHRKNILSPLYKRLGVGTYYGGEYGVYYTEDFYTP
ncbi:cell wall-binding repeat-containing protein [Rossellomorea vietnamensis]|uniref:cell wall-binding repeat-containing protein n=1 Tax=Rossellomorea vietnamensis TaxID=218284 RepID=UPI001CCC70E9|nr:cell wall-binding repeat-containing protein [Rossellomorea vietnamensis]MCA0151575.1 cell wall-binding repeat-containing protein [Rossellomorea vietnamensis]